MLTPRSFKLKRHSRRVLLCKRGLPVFAFLLASLMLLWPTVFAEQKEQFSIAVKTDKKQVGANVDMEQIRFYSRNKKDQPLTVTAPKVIETDTKKQIITLYRPVAVYEMSAETTLTAKTSYGLAYQAEDYLLFEDEVITTTNTGYKAISTQVICDNKNGIIYSDNPVTITGPTGKLKAQGFKIYNHGDNIDFLKHTDTTVFSDQGNIRIRSENGLFVVQPRQEITALQNVVITQDNKKLTADKVVLAYNTKDQNADNQIRTIEAFGHVVAQNDTHKVTGEHGIYDPGKGIIMMMDNVVLYQGDSHMDGETATINLNTGESTLVPKTQSANQSTRVRGKLNPTDFKGDKK